MEICTFNYYLGRDKEGVAVLDEKSSGVFILGAFASLKEIGIIVVKMFFNSNTIRVLDEFVIHERKDSGEAKLKVEEFTYKYNIKHFFGNKKASRVVNQQPYFGRPGVITSGFEAIEISPENLVIIADSIGKNTIIIPELKDIWNREFRSFDLDLVRTKSHTYPRTAALSTISEGANISTNGMISPSIPDKIIDRETGKEISIDIPLGHTRINRGFELFLY